MEGVIKPGVTKFSSKFQRFALLLVSFLCLSDVAYGSQLLRTEKAPKDIFPWMATSQSQNLNQSPHRLEQDTSTYDEYVPLVVPFTQTDNYLKLDAFLIGLKLDDWYLNSTNCLNSIIYTIDDWDYLTNNRTLYLESNETWLNPWLNFTGMVGGPVAASLPFCYQFQKSIVETEKERFESYNGWGEIMIAFLFNQMGNALEFQQKFTNIKLDQETQNYQGVWMEYGDLVHIIWDFQQLEASPKESLQTFMNVFMPSLNSTDSTEALLFLNAMEKFADYIGQQQANLNKTVQPIVEKSTSIKESVDSTVQTVKNTIDTVNTHINQKLKQHHLQAVNAFDWPWDAQRLAYGFMNGAVDVFPYRSLPDLCRDNVTFTRKTIDDLFVDGRYNLPTENLEYVTAIAELLTYPYGLSFSCMFGAREVFTVKGKETNTTGFSDEELFANDLMVVNDVITNAIFNLGYLYSDVSGYLLLDANNLNYWSYTGAYFGDFIMRFFYRVNFSTSFQFDLLEACDTTDPDVTCLE